MTIDPYIFDLEKLRRQAMKVLQGKTPVTQLKLFESEMLELIHELEVYRVELEMIQDELERTDEQLVDLTHKYDELTELHNRFILRMIKSDQKSPK